MSLSPAQIRKRANPSGCIVPNLSSPSRKRQREHLSEPPTTFLNTLLTDSDLQKKYDIPCAMDDSDQEDGDRVLTRGRPRNWRNLERNGFAPVWVNGEGYPHLEIPEEILYWLDEEGNSSLQMIGPLRSMAWIAGLDGLVDAIDSPAYSITDQIEILPRATNILWVVESHIEDGTITEDIADRVLALNTNRQTSLPIESAPKAIVRAEIPAGLSESPSSFQLNSLIPSSRLRGDSRQILSMKATWGKGKDAIRALSTKIRKQAGDHLSSNQLWFRGLSLHTLELTLAFFVPAITGYNRDNEFGPGLYTTNSLEYSLEYVRGNGAVMVFKSPNQQDLTVWQPDPADWTTLVCEWQKLPLAVASQPLPRYTTADFIHGAISTTKQPSGRNAVPTQSDDTQLVATSYRGLQALSDSLSMIIFIDRA